MVVRLDKLVYDNAHNAVRLWHDARLITISSVALLGLLVSSQAVSAQRTAFDSLPPGSPVVIRPLYGDDQVLRVLLLDVSGFPKDRVRQVIRDQRSWQSFWTRARVSSNQKVAPLVDFDRDMVIAASDSGSLFGPEIAIQGAVTRADSLYVLVRSGIGVLPGCHDNAYQHRMAIVLLPKNNRTVVFVETQRNDGCGYRPSS